jgi:hypothetical protein
VRLSAPADQSTDDLFRQALAEEELNQNLPAAIKGYQDVIAKLDTNRRMEATALFHLGECFGKVGKKKEAALQYRRVLHDFPEQTNLVHLCQMSLRNSGVAEPVVLGGTATFTVDGNGTTPLKYQWLAGNPTPLAEWIFAQKDGNVVPDATGHGYNALIHGHPRLVSGPGGSQALEFDTGGTQSPSTGGLQEDGKLDAVFSGVPNAFWSGGAQDSGLSVAKRLNRAFTELSVEAWLRKSPGWWMPIIYRDLWDTPSGFGLYAEWSSGKMAFGHYDSTGNKSEVFSETTVQDGRWHHVVGTMQAAADNAYLYRIYVDGNLEKESTGTLAIEEAPPEGGILKIAYPNASGADVRYQGALGTIAIYDVALTPAQVKAHFEAGRE